MVSRSICRAVLVLATNACWCAAGLASDPFTEIRDKNGTKVFVVPGKAETFDVDLLPKAPKSYPTLSSWSEFAEVPEVGLEEPLRALSRGEAKSQIEFRFALVNTLNRKRTDGFLYFLLERRPDLAGLPFRMGDDCWLADERADALGDAARQLRSDRTHMRADPAFVSAAMQILGPEESQSKMAAAIGHVSGRTATSALVRLVLFSPDEKARETAATHLKTRATDDYTEALVAGLRYPLPIVAQRAAGALVRLERNDLVERLIDVLESEDPRRPVLASDGFRTRELVRINHHRNCLLCHAPLKSRMTIQIADAAAKGDIDSIGRNLSDRGRAARGLDMEVPLPGQPFPGHSGSTPDGYYRDEQSLDDQIEVRADVTYLRQDFSAMQTVEDSSPWPHRQRFDFLIRTRTLTDAEAKVLADKLRPTREGEISPYHRAAASALRELTGQEATSAAEWRRLLKLASR